MKNQGQVSESLGSTLRSLRQQYGLTLQEMAEKTGCAIIPMAMIHTADIFENHLPFIRRTHVILTYGEPIYVKNLTKEQRKHLGNYTRDIICKMLEEELERSASR